MQPESTQGPNRTNFGQAATNNCPNCQAAMPASMRFCRLCGHRLDEGVAEYTETVRLPHAQAAQGARPAGEPRPSAQSPFEMPYWGAIARDARGNAMNSAAPAYGWPAHTRRRRRRPWLMWPLIGIVAATMAGGSILSPLRGRRSARTGISAPAASRSFVGVDGFSTTDGGVTFDVVSPAGSAADRAGLVGGDIVTSFDGHTVRTSDEMMTLLTATPVGKSVDVTYIRDGVAKTTKLTTISQDEYNTLVAVAKGLPKGYLGVGDFDRTQVPGSNTYGVKIDDLRHNRPADLAGLRDGDIVTEFDTVPIRTSDELISRIKRATPGSTVKVVVVREGQRMEIPVKMGQDD